MNRLINFNEFLFDMICEKKDGKIPFLISDRLKDLLYNIKDSEIVDELLYFFHDNNDSDVTLIDISDKNNMFKVSLSSKILSDYERRKEEFNPIGFKIFHKHNQNDWNKFRTDMRIGKLIQKLFGDDFNDQEIEKFVYLYKSEYDIAYSKPILEIVSGGDIVHWYDYDNYKKVDRETVLHNSCMSDEECGEYLRFYELNSPDKVEMLVMYEDENKLNITARALLWHLDYPKDRIFMDRIYYMNEHQVNIFKKYAEENGWLFKKRQTSSHTPIVDSLNGTIDRNFVMNIKNFKLTRKYPYLDTLYYLYQNNNILSNIIDLDVGEKWVKLNDTDGGVIGGVWSNYYNKYVTGHDGGYIFCNLLTENYSYVEQGNKYRLKEDATYFPFYGEYAPNDKIKMGENVFKTTFGEEYLVLKEDAVWLKYYNKYTTRRYAENNMHYSEYYDDYVSEKDLVISYNHDNVFFSKSEVVYLNEEDAMNDNLPQMIPQEEIGKSTYEVDGKNILK